MASIPSRVVLGAAVAALMLGGPGIAEAQARPDAPATSDAAKQAAKKLVDEGIAAQDAKDYDKAIELYQQAYALVPHSILMFNIGQAHRLAGRLDRAVPLYEYFLELDPDGPESEAARAHLAQIKAALENTALQSAPRETSPRDEQPDREIDDQGDEEGNESEGGIEAARIDAPSMYSRSERAVDLVVGLSFTSRHLTFHYNGNEPPSERTSRYKQSLPVPGVYIEATVFPFAVGHERKGILRHIGATVMYDRALALEARKPDDDMKLKATEQRYAAGLALRFPLGSGATAPVIGAVLRYGQQEFTIHGEAATPDVHYTLIDLTGFLHYPIGPKVILNLSAGVLLPTAAGEITTLAHYGYATIRGFEASAGVDYLLTKNIFVRGQARLETLGYSFLGIGMRSSGVESARDTYFGGILTAGYLL